MSSVGRAKSLAVVLALLSCAAEAAAQAPATTEAASAALVTPQAAAVSRASPCDPVAARRAIIAIRDATPEVLRVLRTHAAEVLAGAGDDARAAACAAAVVAEGAVVGGDLAAAHDALVVMAKGLPHLADDIRPHQILILAELGRVAEARQALAAVSKKSGWYDRLVAMIGPPSERRAALRRRASRDADAAATLCSGYDDVDGGPPVAGDAAACQQLALRAPGHPTARALENATALPPFRGALLAARLKALLEAARPGRVVV